MANLDEERGARTGGSEAGRRRFVEPGNGAAWGDGERPEDRGWLPVVGGRRPVSRVDPEAPETPAPLIRVGNGSSRYRSPSNYDPMYSPIYYHFSRVQAHEMGRPPVNVWLALLAMVGVALALLLVASLPGLLSHGASNPVASPSATSAASQSEVPLASQISAPPRIETPTPTPTVAPQPSYRTTYKVQAGDTITRIAEKFGLKTWELQQANPGLTASGLKIGRVLNIPTHGQLTPKP